MARFLWISILVFLPGEIAGSVLAKPQCTNSCTASSQRSQASVFCSAFEGTGRATTTIYPTLKNKPLTCCYDCSQLPLPPHTSNPPPPQSLPSTLQPTAPPKTTPTPTPPPCLGSATGLDQTSSQCACLGVTKFTTTETYSSALTLTGPFSMGLGNAGANRRSENAVNQGRFQKAISYEGNNFLTTNPDSSGNTLFWLDQFGRLFDSDPPGIPFTVSNQTFAKPNFYSLFEQAFFPSAGSEYLPVICDVRGSDAKGTCTLDCQVFDYPTTVASGLCPANHQYCLKHPSKKCTYWLGLANSGNAPCFFFHLLGAQAIPTGFL